MTNEFKKIKEQDETRFILESATAGATSAGAVASSVSPIGKIQKRDNILAQEADKDKVPATTPRNFVAKNAKSSGAGAHKDAKKASQLVRGQKHKNAEIAEATWINGVKQDDKELVWKQTSMSYEEACKKYGKENCKIGGKTGRGEDAVLVKVPRVAEATEYGIPDSTPGHLPGGAKMTFGEFKKMWPGVILKRPSGGSLAGSVVADVEGWMNNPKSVWEPLQGVAEEFDGEYDDEAGMARSNLLTSARAVMGLLKTIKNRDNLPEWAQEKIAKAEMMLVSVWDYLQSQKEQGIDPKVESDEYTTHLSEMLGYMLGEKIPPNADVDYYIKDFAKSTAPQFKGKPPAKRKQMAIAAYYSSKQPKKKKK